MSKVTINLPTRFEKVEEEAQDNRFQKVRIYIAHTGENLNNSVFSREVLEDMIPTLANVPILGYVAKNEEGDKDFRGHEKKVVIEDNGIYVKFMTSAFGFIPEDNNAHFEITGGKEWLVADGVLWTRFADAMDIFDKANGSKAQSMEISNADGYQDKRGRMVFTKAEFTGLCILGDDVPPAMKGSTISTIFSQEGNLKSMFEEMIAEYSAEKGVNELPTKKKDKDEATSVTEPKAKEQEPVKAKASVESKEKATSDSAETKAALTSADSGEEKVAQPADEGKSSAGPAHAEPKSEEHEEESDEMACGTGPKKKKKTFKKEDSKEEDPEEDNEEPAPADESDDKSEDEPEDDKKKSDKAQFELNLSDRVREFIRAAESNIFPQGEGWVNPVDIYEDYGIVKAIFYDKNESAYIRFNYTVGADDSIQLSDKTEVFPRYLTAAEVKKVEDDRNMAAELQKQIDELQAYKNGIEMSKKSEILEGARDSIENEQYQAIKAQFEKLTPEEVEKEVAFAIYKNGATFQKATKSSGLKTVDFNAETDYGYGSANALFHK